MYQEDIYYLHFDGCSKGNPGISGIGAVIYYNGEEVWGASDFIGTTTNNVAEYKALILGLKKAIDLDIKDLIVKGDSNLVIKQMKGEYSVKSDNLIALYKEAKMLEQQFDHISFIHVYRNLNKRADELANIPIVFSQ